LSQSLGISPLNICPLPDVALCSDSSPFDRSDYIAPLVEELGIPGASKLYFLAHRDFPYIPDCNIKAYTMSREIIKVYLNIIAVTWKHQDFAFLLLSLQQPTIKVGMGNFAAFMTADGFSSYVRGNCYHSLSLAGMTFEMYSPADHPEGLCFGQIIFSRFFLRSVSYL
jgi:hypothetical protein